MSATKRNSGLPALIHVCGRYLPASETFTYDLIRGLTGFDHRVVASSVENLDLFPLSGVMVPDPEEQAWTLAEEAKARAVICHFGPQATLGMTLSLVADRPAVTIFHGYDVSRLLRDKRWVERYRTVFALGMQAICISEAGKSRLIEIGCPADQITVIHLGVDTDRFSFIPLSERWIPGRPLRLLMVARLVAKKGVDVALRAVRRLRDQGFDLELRIIGDGPERPGLEALLAELRLECVTLLGQLNHERTREEFDRAGLYIQPSITAESGDQEGIPVSLMEAQASGLPVVSTRHSGIPELVLDGKSGILTDEGDADGLAEGIFRIAQDPELAARFVMNGRARVATEFNRDLQSRRFSSYLNDLIDDEDCRPSRWLQRRTRPAKRALVVRSIPAGLMARKLLILAHRHPEMSFDVLTSRSSVPALSRLPLVDHVFGYEDGRLSLRRLGVDEIRHLQEAGYDLAIVPYGDETGEAYANVRRVAASCGARRRVALTLRDREVPIAAQRCRPRLAEAPRSEESHAILSLL